MLIIYTGNGKGKTTSAFGVILRSLSLGKKVLLLQFMKPDKESAITDLEKNYTNFKSLNFGVKEFIKKGEKPKELNKICFAGFETLKNIYKDYDLIVVDEICISFYFNLLDKNEVLNFIKSVQQDGFKDFILTGRKCPKEFIDLADIVTEMKLIKHHYNLGIPAKKGIDY